MTPAIDDPAHLLFVCTGNICRSPAAEFLLRATVGMDPTMRTSSAGVAAVVGSAVDPPIDRLLRQRGIDSAGFRARQLTEPLIAGSDLVLTMTAAHRGAVVQMCPRAVHHCFTLREFAAMLESADPTTQPSDSMGDRLRRCLRSAKASRQATGGPVLEVPDPHRRAMSAYEESLALIEEALTPLTDRLLE